MALAMAIDSSTQSTLYTRIMAYRGKSKFAHTRKLQLTLITGPPGVGKTTLLSGIAACSGKTILLAPTLELCKSARKRFKDVQTVALAALSKKRDLRKYSTVMITEAGMMTAAQCSSIIGKLSANVQVYLDLDPFQIPAVLGAKDQPLHKSSTFDYLLQQPETRLLRLFRQYRTKNRRVLNVIKAVQENNRLHLEGALLELISGSLVNADDVPYNEDTIAVAHTHRIRNWHWNRYCNLNNLTFEPGSNLVLGTRVRILITKKTGTPRRVVYANGDICTLLEVQPGFVRVLLDNEEEHRLPNQPDGSRAVTHTFCLTAYSVQGKTSDKNVYVLCDTPQSASVNICISTLYVMATRTATTNVEGPPSNLFFVVHNFSKFARALSDTLLRSGGPFSINQNKLLSMINTVQEFF